MSTPSNQLPTGQMPSDVPSLQNVLKTTIAKLMAHSQTVQELMRANMDLRAALTLAQNDKGQLEAYIKSLLTPAPEAPAEAPADAEPVAAPTDAANEAAPADADSIPA